MKYRPEIDGLRAVAVVSVLIYHCKLILGGWKIFSGGYLGVDVFFVISGYLITSIILKDIAAKKFSFKNFYERRARRILPPLFIVMLSTLPIAWLYIFPKPFVDFSKSIISSIFFGSNILFSFEDSYTAEPSSLKPFLHTWSLSLEEQFYVFFPIFLIVVWKYFRRHLNFIILSSIILSLVLAQWQSYKNPTHNFFLLHTRIWELMFGAILASYEQSGKRIVRSAKLNNGLGFLGLMMVVVPMLVFTDQTRHPSLLTLIPIVGSTLLIWFCNGKDVTSKLLCSPLFVGTGLISYSLYLWHQPLLVFSRIYTLGNPTIILRAACIALSFLLAYLSWKYLETPYRNKEKVSRKFLWSSMGTACLLLIGLNYFVIEYEGFRSRFPQIFTNGLPVKSLGIKDEKGRLCQNRDPLEACHFEGERAKTRIVLVGDSHARTLAEALFSYAQERGLGFSEFTKSGCIFLEEIGKLKKDGGCSDSLQRKRADAFQKLPPSIFVLSGADPVNIIPKTTEKLNQFNALFKKTVINLQKSGHRIVFVYPATHSGEHVPRVIASHFPKSSHKARNFQLDLKILSTPHRVFLQRREASYKAYDSVGKAKDILRVYPEKIFCSTFLKDYCVVHNGADIFFADAHHLSSKGAQLVVQEIIKKIEHEWSDFLPQFKGLGIYEGQ